MTIGIYNKYYTKNLLEIMIHEQTLILQLIYEF